MKKKEWKKRKKREEGIKEKMMNVMSFFGRLLRENNDEEGPRLRINEIAPTRLLRVTPRYDLSPGKPQYPKGNPAYLRRQ